MGRGWRIGVVVGLRFRRVPQPGVLQHVPRPAGRCEPRHGGTSDSFYTLPLPSQVKGATIHSVTAYFPEIWSYSCTASPVDLYPMTGAISRSTTYNNQPAWGTDLGSDNVAYGWSSSGDVNGPSSCPYEANDVSFTGSALISALASPTTSTSLVVGLKAEDTTDSPRLEAVRQP